MTNDTFITTVWSYYKLHKRDLLWRNISNLPLKERSYKVLVSEIMLQQTQVQRVQPAYMQWMQKWPTITTAASASLADVVTMWSGLGYNRRAKYLHTSIRIIVGEYDGILPNDAQKLLQLPGVGLHTAGALLAYVYNYPSVFIETNIRSAYIHAFYATSKKIVNDTTIMHKVADTLDTSNTREWYYALMDYGNYVKRTYGSQLKLSATYKKQAPFNGSKREVRGVALKYLINHKEASLSEIQAVINDNRLTFVLDELVSEQLLHLKEPNVYSIERPKMI